MNAPPPVLDAPPLARRQFRRPLGFIVGSAVVAALTLGTIEWQKAWENPVYLQQEKITEGQFIYLGNPVSVTVSCKCPRYFIQSQTKDITLTFALKASPPADKTLASPVKSHASQLGKPTTNAAQDPSSSAGTTEADVWATVGNGEVWKWWYRDGPFNAETIGPDSRISAGVSASIDAEMTINVIDSANIRFLFGQWDNATHKISSHFDPAGLDWRPEVRPPFWTAAAPFAVSAIVFFVLFAAISIVDYRFRQLRHRTAARLALAQNEPHSAWETARIKLEAYLDRNLIQVNLVFWVAVFVMITGFLFVLVGIYILVRNPGDLSWVKALPAISGLITQFIGATFMVIYRSTMSQANDFMSVLERINTVGMAVHELDRIPDGEKELKNSVRALLVELLLTNGLSRTLVARKFEERKRGKTRKQSESETQQD